jgi:hypothetical protein
VGAARTRIVAPELFEQLFLAVNDPNPSFDLSFGREPFSTLTGALEKSELLGL